jgi:aspartyl-tRNA(Asn)/glutamyl-tRNA(Gln) amidotransferase subunit C
VAVTPDDVKHVALLARLAVAEDRLPTLVRELNTILEHMAVLQDVPVDADAPDERAGMRLRDDIVAPAPMVRPFTTFAPDTRDNLILVPRLDTHDDAGEAGVTP